MKLKNKGISLFVLYLMGGILLTSIESVDADGGGKVEKPGLKAKNTDVAQQTLESTTAPKDNDFWDFVHNCWPEWQLKDPELE